MNTLQKLLYARSGPDFSREYHGEEQFSLQALPATATFRDKFPLLMDISQYQQVIDWDKLKADNAPFIWIRSSYGAIGDGYGGNVDALAADHIQKAFDHNIPCGLYHVLDPGYYFYKLQSLGKMQAIDTYLPIDKDEQIQTLLKGIRYKKFYLLAIDFELCKDWNGNVMPDGWLVEVIFQFLVRIQKLQKAGTIPPVKIVFYSGSWFVDAYCPSLIQTGRIVPLCDLWTAYYPYGSGVVNLANQAALKPLYPPDTMTINNRQTQNPPYLGFGKWTFWQFTGDKFTLPYITDTLGRPSALDFNFFNGTIDQLYAYIGYTPSVTDTTAPTITVTSKPLAETASTGALFEFTITDNVHVASVMASLDGVASTAVTSPALYENLSTGSHAWSLEAKDDAGNMSTYNYNWIITSTPIPPSTDPTLKSMDEKLDYIKAKLDKHLT